MNAWLLLAALAGAQTPAEPWRTVETEHFRVHFPERAEGWGLEAAGQIEAIKLRVDAEVGWSPSRTIDIVIVDPEGDANGSAWPFAAHPRMLLWATPPAADSVIGHYRSWGELLLTHEYAHLVHLMRHSRSPLGRVLERSVGFAPITRKAPRWCIEGYATVVEARLSGYGRPNADFRALLLRRLAQEGRFPTYGELNAFDRYMGGSFAYLVGSAYLEWLEERTGEGSLRSLWARMTARQDRSFDDAFVGVFGERPDVLYARFVAEVVQDAMNLEDQRPVDESTLWNDLSWYTGAPAVSPDGTKIAAVVATQKKPSKLQVWSLEGPDEEAESKRAEALAEALEKDPEDVAPVEPKHPSRKSLHERTSVTRSATDPRWMPDGSGLLFTSWQPTADGRRGPDLFLWQPESGEERRLSRGAGLRHADPFPDGERALAVRQDWGRSHLVIVDLDSGEWEALTEPTVDVLYDQPRVSPAGDRVAWMEHRGTGWSVVVHDAERAAVYRVGGVPGEVIPYHIAWAPDGSALYASLGRDGFIEIHEVWGEDGTSGQLTRSAGGALSPSASSDALFYLSMDDDGLEIHRLGLDAIVAPVAVTSNAPVVRPTWTPGPQAPQVVEVEARPYGLGRTEWRPLVGGTWSRSQAAIEAGVRVGDIVGRRDLLLVGSYGRNTGVSGGRLALAWRGFPFEIAAEGFAAWEPPEGTQRGGGLLRVEDGYRGRMAALDWRLAGSFDQRLGARNVELDEGVVVVPGGRAVGYGEIETAWVEPRTAWLRVGADMRGQVGQTDAAPWKRGEVEGTVALGRSAGLRGSYTLGSGDGTTVLDRYRLGGVRTSALPETWQWGRVASPVFDLGSGRGAHRDAVDVAIGQPSMVALVAERHRMSDDLLALGGHGSSAVSLKGGMDFDATPFQRLPAGRIEGGLGCRVEDPVAGWAEKPCQALDDYAFWMRLGWDL